MESNESRDTALAMSEENVKAFKRGSDAASRRDLDVLLEVVDPEVEWHSAVAALIGGESTTYHGHEGVRQWLNDLEEAFSEIKIDYAEIRDLGDRLVALGHFRARGKKSGIPVETPTGWLVEFKGGRVSYVRAYFDPEEALEAAGLSE